MIALQEALEDEAEPPHIIECFDISNISTTHKVASMVCFTGGKPDRSNYRRYRIKTVEGQDDFASMAEVVRRRYSRVLERRHPAAEPRSLSTVARDSSAARSGSSTRWGWPTFRRSAWPRSARRFSGPASASRW